MKRTGLRRRRKVDPARAHRDAVRAAAAPQPPRKKPRRLGTRATPRRGSYRNKALLEATRLMACAFCPKRPPVSAHHFPGKGHLAGIDDRLACPACGDGVRGCHGEAQRYEIPAEEQLAAVGRTLRAHLLAGRVTPEEAATAIARVPRLDWREQLQLAVAVPGAAVVEPST